MYDIDVKNVKKGKKIYVILLVVGLVILGILGAIIMSSYIKLKSLDATTTSTKVIVNSHFNDEGNLMYSPTYYYVVDGREYVCTSSSSSSINPGTKNKTVYYDSKNPEKCMTEYSKSSNKFFIIFLLLPIIFIVVAFIFINKINKRVKLINELNQKGKLIKNLPYRLEDTGIVVNGVPIQRPVVDYTLPSGSTITLHGDPRFDRKNYDTDGLVDLVIDENNFDNYFIDFEINRLSGNLPTDYYSDSYGNQYQNNLNDNTNYSNVNNNFNQNNDNFR